MTRLTQLLTAFLGTAALMTGCATNQTMDTQTASIENNHVILVGHGVPAKDFPRDQLRKFFRAESSQHNSDGDHGHAHSGDEHSEFARLENAVRNWPRTPENDPYKYSVEKIADRLASESGHQVLVAFNEFCAPTVEDAINTAIADGADRIIVSSIMLTPGGGHSERDIPRSIERARQLYPNVEIVYAWPYDVDLIVDTLATQIRSFEAD